MAKEDRQKLLLALLILMLIAVAWRQLSPSFSASSEAGRRTSSQATSRAARTGKEEPLPKVVELRLADLQRSEAHYSPGRDPFRFGEAPKPELPPPDPTPAADDAQIRDALVRATQNPDRGRPPARQPPPVDVVFLGSFGPSARKLAVFSDGRDIYNVLEGGVLKDQFIVVHIGYESADVGFVDFPDTPAQRLAVGG
jgi:hypothetical protein